jgi:oligosaccharyltransferase complex subunit delta (ribophorin II)
LGPSDTLKVALTAKDGKTAKRPHQTFLTIKDTATGLETSYGFAVKESGKGKVELVRLFWIH